MTSVIAVIPAYNEAASITQVVEGARAFVTRVIVVDDGSTDGTAAEAKRAGADVVRRPTNGGKGLALRDGFHRALEYGAQVIVTLDGDGQHSPEEIPRLLDPIHAGAADVVVGSRHLDGVGVAATPSHRRLGQQVLEKAAHVATGTPVSDSESGFRAYRAEVVRTLPLEEPGYATDWEAYVKAREAGFTIVEVPSRARYDVPNPSKQSALSQGLDVGMGVLRFFRLRRPLIFFGAPGLFLLLLGSVLAVQTAQGWYELGEFWPGKALLAALCILLGALLALAALILDTLVRLIARLEPRRE